MFFWFLVFGLFLFVPTPCVLCAYVLCLVCLHRVLCAYALCLVCLRPVSCVPTPCVLCAYALCLVCPVLPVSLDYSFLIIPLKTDSCIIILEQHLLCEISIVFFLNMSIALFIIVICGIVDILDALALQIICIFI